MNMFISIYSILIPLLFLLLCVILSRVIKLEVEKRLHELRQHEIGYRKRSRFMNSSELAFYLELKKVLPSNYHLFSKTRVADFIETIDGMGFYKRRNKILPRHTDFLICNYQMEPVLAIEIDGASHGTLERFDRDQEMDKIYQIAQLPIKHVQVSTNFSRACNQIVESLS